MADWNGKAFWNSPFNCSAQRIRRTIRTESTLSTSGRSGGVDAGVTRKLTVAADLLGQRFYEAPGIKVGGWVDVVNVSHSDTPNTIPVHHSFNADHLALGAKYSPFGNLLVTGNVQIKLENGGLRAQVTPLIGLSHTF